MINLSMAEPDNVLRPRISVIGVGGGGGNALNNMIRSNLEGCDFIAANTDAQALAQSLASRKIQLGVNLSRGLGAGSKPEIGRAAAEEQLGEIMSILEGSDMLFVTAGMGGGTGTGAAPVIARAARESGILTVGVVTRPFNFEGSYRLKQAELGIAELQQYVDTLIVIPNQNLFRIANEKTTFAEAFRMADEVLHSGVRGITDLMVMPGFMNLDFADVKTVMGEMGKAMMGTGEADGENRAVRAAEAAISNPLLDDISMKGARGVLINITGGLDMTLFEMDEAATRIREEVDPEAQIKVGSTLGEDMDGRIRVSVIATGIDAAIAAAEKERQDSASQQRIARSTAAASAVRVVTETPRRAPVAAAPVVSAPAPVQKPAPAMTSPYGASTMAAPAQSSDSSSAQSGTQAGSATTASMNVNLSGSYFSMPSAVTPQMVAQRQTVTPRAAAPVAAAPVQEAPEEQEPREQAPRLSEREAAMPARAAAPAPASPVRQIPPAYAAQPAARGTKADAGEMRMTQLTTGAAAAQPTSSAPTSSHRSQSLFQRITGFGMVRPSAQTEEDDDLLSPQEDVRAAPSSFDRSALSSESDDLLDIPAFLRRQSNR